MVHEVLIESLGKEKVELIYDKSYDSYLSVIANKPIFRKKDMARILNTPADILEITLLTKVCNYDQDKYQKLISSVVDTDVVINKTIL